LPKYQKRMPVCPFFFETNLEKNILTPDNKLFLTKEYRKNRIKKRKKKNFCKAIGLLPVLTASL